MMYNVYQVMAGMEKKEIPYMSMALYTIGVHMGL